MFAYCSPFIDAGKGEFTIEFYFERVKPGFKYCLFNPSFWSKLKKEIIKQYEYENIPVIE